MLLRAAGEGEIFHFHSEVTLDFSHNFTFLFFFLLSLRIVTMTRAQQIATFSIQNRRQSNKRKSFKSGNICVVVVAYLPFTMPNLTQWYILISMFTYVWLRGCMVKFLDTHIYFRLKDYTGYTHRFIYHSIRLLRFK